MNEYHKIQSLFKRDMENKYKTLLDGQWALPEFEFLAMNTWVFTEKVDGMNIRVMIKNGSVTFGGKTSSTQIPSQLETRLNYKFLPLSTTVQELFGCDVCLYGEGYGANIQKDGGNYRLDQDFVLFDIKVGNLWIQRLEVENVVKKLDIDVVPIIGEGTLYDAILAAKTGIVSTWGNFQAEGIVARPKTELRTCNGHRIITKIKCRDFLS